MSFMYKDMTTLLLVFEQLKVTVCSLFFQASKMIQSGVSSSSKTSLTKMYRLQHTETEHINQGTVKISILGCFANTQNETTEL